MVRIFLKLIAVTALLAGCVQESVIKPTELLCEAKTNPTGIATTQPGFNWKNIATVNKAKQTAYQILVASSPALLKEGKADLWDSGKVTDSNSVWVSYKGKQLKSRSVGYWKIKVWDQNSTPSKWSGTQSFSVGLLNADDWKGDYIGMSADEAADKLPFLRKTVVVSEKYDELYMHVSSLGYHELYVNGKKVGDALLAPAESPILKRVKMPLCYG
jgi:alpha-L-rhamnosidase